jgi:prepilin-type processing-associated H-X9-DG protein
MAMQLYINDNKGTLPPTFKPGPDSVLRMYLETDKFESCPDTSEGGMHRYVYLLDHIRDNAPSVSTNLSSSAPRPIKMHWFRNASMTPLLWDDAARHNGKRGVAFLDGHAELMAEAEFQQALGAAVQEITQRMGGR